MAGQPDCASEVNAQHPLQSKKIVLGVAGGISAYKSVEILRRLMQAGATVWPVMTEKAQNFVGRTTLSALASEPAKVSLFDGGETAINHTRLGQDADLILLAPATANTIAKYCHGIADDLLTNTLIATRAPVLIAPAMHTEMWEHPAVQDNIATLKSRNVHFVGPVVGPLAGGDTGSGRLSEPADIVRAAQRLLLEQKPVDNGNSQQRCPTDSKTHRQDFNYLQNLKGKSVVISAGGTREAIDPVRYIGNHSTGRQGHCFAHIAAKYGARVTLVTTAPEHVFDSCAPDTVKELEKHIEIVAVTSAAQMYKAIKAAYSTCDLVIMTAAVADFTPASVAETKIKKSTGFNRIELVPTVDILAELGAAKQSHQRLIGFAAETNNVIDNARRKLETKNLDMVVVNDITEKGAGFGGDTNAVTIVYADRQDQQIAKTSKTEIAKQVLAAFLSHLG